jgi:flagellar export protein FliJ
MSAKKFSLEAVLDLRAAAKERAEQALATAMREREQAIAACEWAEAELAALAAQLGGGRFTAASRQQGWNAMCRQREHCGQLRAALADVEKRVLALRTQLVSASIDHELVVRLKQKWTAAQARIQARAEELQLEEFVAARQKPRLTTP